MLWQSSFLLRLLWDIPFIKRSIDPTSLHQLQFFIPTDTDFEGLIKIIEPYVKDMSSFIWVAEKKNYPNKIRAGKFRITEGMNNETLVDHLRGGKQENSNTHL